jgi:hypothetical protein
MKDHLLGAVTASIEYWVQLCEEAAKSEDPRARLLHLRSKMMAAHSTLSMFERRSPPKSLEAQKSQIEDFTL